MLWDVLSSILIQLALVVAAAPFFSLGAMIYRADDGRTLAFQWGRAKNLQQKRGFSPTDMGLLYFFLPRHGHNDIRMGYAFDIGILSRYVFLAFIARARCKNRGQLNA